MSFIVVGQNVCVLVRMTNLLFCNVAANGTVLVMLLVCRIVVPGVRKKLAVFLVTYRAVSLARTGCCAAGVISLCRGNYLIATRAVDCGSTISIVCIRCVTESLAFGFATKTTGFRQYASSLIPLMIAIAVAHRQSKNGCKENERENAYRNA